MAEAERALAANARRPTFALTRACAKRKTGNSPLRITRVNNGRDAAIRTRDPLTPSQVRYQAALHPDPTRVTARPELCDTRSGPIAALLLVSTSCASSSLPASLGAGPTLLETTHLQTMPLAR